MANITIREVDSTSASISANNNNIAYVPGYAITGPVNTPTLCESLEQFQVTFGYEPYVFKTKQAYPSFKTGETDVTPKSAMYEIGDYEKSYIYAAELLKLGLPILYERVLPEHKISEGLTVKPDNLIAKLYFTKSGIVDLTTGTLNESETEFTKTEGGSKEDIVLIISANTIGTAATDTLVSYSVPSGTQDYFELKITCSKKIYGKEETEIIRFTNVEDKVDLTISEPIRYYKDISSKFVNFKWLSDLQTIKAGDSKGVKLSIDSKYTTDVEGQVIDEFNVSDLYTKMSDSDFWDSVDRLTAKGEYDFKYLTSGAYPVFEHYSSGDETAVNSIATNMIECAETRGDATAYIDSANNKTRTLIASKKDSVYYSYATYMRTLGNDYSIYSALFTPWYRSNCSTVNKIVEMPASFAYLSSLAKMIQIYPSYLAVAGVTRGLIPNFVSPCQNITNAMADSYQPRNDVAINAITNIKPYGYVIWGNRTGKNNAIDGNLTAQSFLNVRQMVSDIKKLVYIAAKSLTFEQNNDILWVNFKSKITPTLDKMVTSNGISGYKVIQKPTTEKAKIVALIKIYPIEPVEDWDITIELSDAEVVVQ